jgi:thymidine kinase
LIRIINRYKCLNKSVIVINHSFNNRYGTSGLSTHNNEKFEKCIILDKLDIIDKDLLNNTDVIIIEELQFFDSSYETIIDWCDNYKKTVIAAGLDGDFKRNPFGDVLKLIPHAEKITKLSALYKRCGNGTLAHFSKRIVENNDKTLVGGNDIYEAVCRFHYLC